MIADSEAAHSCCMVGMVVCGGDKERDVQSTAAVLKRLVLEGLVFCRSGY